MEERATCPVCGEEMDRGKGIVFEGDSQREVEILECLYCGAVKVVG